MIKVDTALRERLLAEGVSTLWRTDFALPDNSVFEAPCSIKWMSVAHSLRLGAFSYAVSGYFFACQIGRYTSIGEQVQIGRGNHPTSWFSSSPVFYGPLGAIVDGVDSSRISGVDFAKLAAEPFIHATPPARVEPVQIGNDVWIGHGVFVKPGIQIGDGAIVGAQAVVTRDVPPYAIVVGNPGRVIRYRFPDSVIQRLLALKWWNYSLESLRGIALDNIESALDVLESRLANGLATPFVPKVITLDEFVQTA